jgi:4-hydroxy-3-polyprenylbenzoate decarboxylase
MTVVAEQVHARRARFRDLREWLELVDEMGQLKYVDGATREEIGDATDLLQHQAETPSVVFDNIPGYRPGYRVNVNCFGATARIALTLGMPTDLSKAELVQAWREKTRGFKPIPAEYVTDGPVFENVQTGADVNMLQFPAPKWHPEDGGYYIGTGSYDITRDPDDGWVNLGTYRVMQQDERHVGYYISPGKHGRIHREKYFQRGERMPVAMVFGGDPLTFLAGCTEIPYGLTEYDWVGGVRGEPVRVIKGPVTGLPIPADAEIVIEGFANPEARMEEGPFGEWAGYYASGARREPVIDVEAVYWRTNPIILGSPPGTPPDEQSRFRAIMRTGRLFDQLEAMGIPDVTGAWCHEVGGSRLFVAVAIKQRYNGHARQVGHAVVGAHATAYTGRIVVVVDDDVDVTNLDEVMWAVCTRTDPAEDLDIVRKAWSTPLDPRVSPIQRERNDFSNSRLIIDATRPYEWKDEFPPVGRPPKEYRDRVRARWGYLVE